MIKAMYVHPDMRMQKTGTLMVNEVINRARAMEGLEQIHLWVLQAVTPASRFYRTPGFDNQGPLVEKDLKYNGRYINAEYMVLYL